MLEEVKILEQVEKLSLNPTIIQVLSSTLRLQQKNYKNKNMKHYEHKFPTYNCLYLKKKQKVLWTNITDILDLNISSCRWEICVLNVSYFYSYNFSAEV